MPIYDYTCTTCNNQFDKFVQKIDTETVECPKCSGVAKRNGFERVSPFRWGRGGSWN